MCSSYIVDIFTFALFCTTLCSTLGWMIDETPQTCVFFSLFSYFFFCKEVKISSHSCVYQLTSIVHTVYILKPVGSMKLYCACNIFNANKKNTRFFPILFGRMVWLGWDHAYHIPESTALKSVQIRWIDSVMWIEIIINPF